VLVLVLVVVVVVVAVVVVVVGVGVGVGVGPVPLDDSETMSMAISLGQLLPVVPKKRNLVTSPDTLTDAAFHSSPWSPAWLQSCVQSLAVAVLPCTTNEPMDWPYM